MQAVIKAEVAILLSLKDQYKTLTGAPGAGGASGAGVRREKEKKGKKESKPPGAGAGTAVKKESETRKKQTRSTQQPHVVCNACTDVLHVYVV